MKKIILMLLIAVMMFSSFGCGSKEVAQSDNDDVPKDKDVQEKAETIDLHDESLLLDFVYARYDVSLERELLKDEMKAVYGDYNNDGIEDVAYFSPDNNGFYEVAFITAKDGYIFLIPNDIDLGPIYTHDISFDGTFIHYEVNGGGTGINNTLEILYVYDGTKIKDTRASMTLDGYASGPNYATETVGKTTCDIPGDYRSFIHEVKTTGTEENYTKQKFVYNPDSFEFTITDLQTEDNKKEDSIKENESVTNENVYIGKDLKLGDKVSEYFTIKHFSSGDLGSESINFTLTGDSFVEGTLSGTGAGQCGFRFNKPIIDKSILLNSKLNDDGTEIFNIDSEECFYIDPTEMRLGEDIPVYLSQGGELKAKGFVKEIYYENTPMDSFRTTIITEFKIEDSELEKVFGTTEKRVGLDFTNETLYSLDEEKVIDYSKYELVIVPMQQSINELSELNFSFDEEAIYPLTVCIFGHLSDVTLEYTKNSNDQEEVPDKIFVGDVCDRKLTIEALMPTDFSFVTVNGTFVDSKGEAHNVEFSLDDCRDPESYQILTY